MKIFSSRPTSPATAQTTVFAAPRDRFAPLITLNTHFAFGLSW